ncbi:MAG TPA: hypothetical protein VL522_02460, partial [Bordetella sp.]|nr:hypothetical protein [Bordetella sp.]
MVEPPKPPRPDGADPLDGVAAPLLDEAGGALSPDLLQAVRANAIISTAIVVFTILVSLHEAAVQRR